MKKALTLAVILIATPAFAETASPAGSPDVATLKPSDMNVSAKQASELTDKQQALMLDVREPNEVAYVRIPGAVSIPLSQLKNRLGELAAFRGKPVITQCRTGRRSSEALKILSASGFTKVKNLDGGIVAWMKSGLKTEGKCC
jgi:rhodanese-related sulfurtransferase